MVPILNSGVHRLAHRFGLQRDPGRPAGRWRSSLASIGSWRRHGPGRTVGEITWRLRSYHGPCIIGASSWNG